MSYWPHARLLAWVALGIVAVLAAERGDTWMALWFGWAAGLTQATWIFARADQDRVNEINKVAGLVAEAADLVRERTRIDIERARREFFNPQGGKP